MDGSSGSSVGTLDLHFPEYPDQDAFLPSISLVSAVNPAALMRNVTFWSQEIEPKASKAPTSSFLNPCNQCESAGTSNGHHPIKINDVRLEPTPRKSHNKSRRGCHSCKARRVKCPENYPVCSQCTRRGLKCEWPELYVGQAGNVTERSPSIPQQVVLSSPIFTSQDFRLFHHFIQDAHPIKPHGNESIWTHEVPSISHNYDHLLHAMLALSASDLEASPRQPSSELTQAAMSHRILAIKSLNRAISTGMHSPEDGNAILATCYILLCQSTLMDEGLPEFLTFTRGCVLVPIQMDCKGLKFLLQNLLSEDEIEMTRPYLQSMPAIDLSPVDAACASLEALAPLCKRESEKIMREQTLEILRKFYLSSCDAYLAWLKGSIIFSCTINHAEFLNLIDPSNVVGKLLLSHFVAMQSLLVPISVDERGNRKALQFVNRMVRWLDVLHANLEPSIRKYFEWPIKRAEELREWFQSERALA